MNPTSAHQRQVRSPQNVWQRRLRYFYLRFVRLRGGAEAIARGIAAGVFAGWFPLFGFQTIMGIALATLLKGNKLMAVAATWVSNPFTYVPIYYFNFRVGQHLLAGVGVEAELPEWSVLQDILTESGWDAFSQLAAFGGIVSAALFWGCFSVGLVSAIAAYFLGLWFVQRRRDRPKMQRDRP
ncbi:MAG: DUF2062 domain-containing protein [Leptolyngbyaceae cyanobacterium]